MFGLIQDAGFAGWIILLLFIAGIAAVTTVGRRWGRPGSTAAAWAVAVLAAGAFGYGVGQRKVNDGIRGLNAQQTAQPQQQPAPVVSDSERIERAGRRVAMLSQGTSEAAANYVLAGIAALLLSMLGGALVFFRRGAGGAPSAATTAPVPAGQPARAG